jgi:hypothetical protein
VLSEQAMTLAAIDGVSPSVRRDASGAADVGQFSGKLAIGVFTV